MTKVELIAAVAEKANIFDCLFKNISICIWNNNKSPSCFPHLII